MSAITRQLLTYVVVLMIRTSTDREI